MGRRVFPQIQKIYNTFGNDKYTIGEPITQTQHALQTYRVMAETGGTPELCVGALLHDIGHFLYRPFNGQAPMVLRAGDTPINPFEENRDDLHEDLGADYLKFLGFPSSVFMPVRLHVHAKRYLCSTNRKYYDSLTDASRKSFELQGGMMKKKQIKNFEKHPFFKQAINLRECDDVGKNIQVQTLVPFESLEELVESVL